MDDIYKLRHSVLVYIAHYKPCNSHTTESQVLVETSVLQAEYLILTDCIPQRIVLPTLSTTLKALHRHPIYNCGEV